MVNKDQTLEHCRTQLADLVQDHAADLPECKPLNITPWLAMSLMQKAIRRGREDLALSAAATLLQISPARLWRRLCVTAYEDIGVADLESVFLVTSALKGKTWRSHVGGEWPVASYLVSRLARTIKCRSADDLLVIVESCPKYKEARLDLSFRPTLCLLKCAVGEDDLLTRALALWYAVGTQRYSSVNLHKRRGEPQAAFDFLWEAGLPDAIVEVAREGFRKCSEVLCPFVVLLWRELQNVPHGTGPDDIPAEELIGGVPCWAFDMYVREGNRAMERFLTTDCDTARWVNAHLPKGQRRKFLGLILFRVEGGMVSERLRWKVGDDLRQISDLECFDLEPTKVAEVMVLLRSDLPILNEARRNVYVSNLR